MKPVKVYTTKNTDKSDILSTENKSKSEIAKNKLTKLFNWKNKIMKNEIAAELYKLELHEEVEIMKCNCNLKNFLYLCYAFGN